MQLFEKMATIDDPDEQVRYAQEYARLMYPDLADVEFSIPEQGEQKFVFMTNDEVICIARSPEVSTIMQSEADTLNTLEKVDGVETPTVNDFQPDNHIMRVSKLDGTALTPERLASMPPEKQADLAQRMGVFIGKMHNVLPQDKKITMPWKDHALSNISSAFGMEADPENKSRIEAARSYITDNTTIDDSVVTLHSDLHQDNVLYDEDSDTLGLIDFTGVKSGYRHREFTKIYRSYPEPFLDGVIAGYSQQTGQVIDKSLITVSSDTFDMVIWQQGQPAFLERTAQ